MALKVLYCLYGTTAAVKYDLLFREKQLFFTHLPLSGMIHLSTCLFKTPAHNNI